MHMSTIKHSGAVVLLFLLALTSNKIQAKETADVVIHINDPKKMTMLINNVVNLRKTLGKDSNLTVVVNGPAVARFTKITKSRKQLEQLLAENAEVAVCSFALKNKNIIKEQLYKDVIYLKDGGVAKLVELQNKGYAYIKP